MAEDGAEHGDETINSDGAASGQTAERVPTFPELPIPEGQRHGLNVLRDAGYLAIDQQGRVIVDVEALKGKEMDFSKMREQMGTVALGKATTSKARGYWSKAELLPKLFDGLTVYSKEDYNLLQTGESVSPKSLFYIPEDEDAAIDPERIPEQDFYIGLWEMHVARFPLQYPTQKEGIQSHLSSHEAISACLLFHPKFGNGARDENGDLIVSLPDGTRQPISYRFFEAWEYGGMPNYYRQGQERVNPAVSPAEFFIQQTPGLVERGLIDPWTDFKIVHSDTMLGPAPRRPTTAGYVQIEGARYNLGREFSGNRGFTTIQLSDTHVGIVSTSGEKPELVGAFQLRAIPREDEPGYTWNRTQTGAYPSFRKDQFTHYSQEDLENNPELQGLKINFDTLQTITKELGELPYAERSALLSTYMRLRNYNEFWDFALKFGTPGLRSLVAFQGLSVAPETLWEFLSDEDSSFAALNAVGAVVQTAYEYRKEVRDRLSPEDREKADMTVDALVEHAGKIALSILPAIKEGKGSLDKFGYDKHDVVSQLHMFKSRMRHTLAEQFNMETGWDKDYSRLLELFHNEENPARRAMLLQELDRYWINKTLGGGQPYMPVYKIQQEIHRREVEVGKESDRFYTEYTGLTVQADETTADTEYELDHLREYVESRVTTLKEGETLEVIDVGCGDGKRLTKPIADLFPQIHVTGVDRLPSALPSEGNLTFRQEDLTRIGLPDTSADVIMANWSVINDLTTRPLQQKAIAEAARLLRVRGQFRVDVPYLEGGKGSWMDAAVRYHHDHKKEDFGKIVATFPADDTHPGGYTKEFYIYPEFELDALLESNGFKILDKTHWRTRTGKPRMTVVAELEKKMGLPTPHPVVAAAYGKTQV